MVYEIEIKYPAESRDEKIDKIRLIIEKYRGAYVEHEDKLIIFLTEENNALEKMTADLENIGIDVLFSERKSERRVIDGLKRVIEEIIDFLTLWK